MILKKGRHLFVDRDMKRFNAAILLVNPYVCWRVVGVSRFMVFDLFGVGFNPYLMYHEPKKLSCRYPESTLSRIKSYLVLFYYLEGLA